MLDGNVTGADRGMWASAVVGGDGTVHVAYQDALGDELMYTTWANGAAGTPEIVDDGVRAGDRTHPVGAAAAIYLVNGAPTIAYQDGMTADVYVAQKGAHVVDDADRDRSVARWLLDRGDDRPRWRRTSRGIRKIPNAMTISSLTVKTQ